MSRFTDGLATAATGDRGITTFTDDAATRTTWAAVRARAARAATVLAGAGVRPGGAVAILAGQPADIAPAAQAAWIAGASVTMLHQPTARTDLARYATDTLAILDVIDASAVIVGDPFTDVAEMLAGTSIRAVTCAQLDAGATAMPPVDSAEDDTALLQLTSGSTATPKAVRITHRNLWANTTAMIDTAAIDPNTDVMVSWLPLFHDMGMVGFLTLPMSRGIDLVKATPMDFLRSPLRWMELIDQYRGTVTAAPNFAYALAARVLPRADGLDLRSLRFALNGAEPIDIAAVRAFLAAGAPFGLRDTAVVPAYGMAEATLGVSFHPWGTPLRVDTVDAVSLEEHGRAVPRDPARDESGGDGRDATGSGSVINSAAATRSFPLLGPPLPGIEVEIRVDGRRRGDREVGTIMVRGEAVTSQYLTADGPLPTRDADGWLDTGDLGYLTDGAIVVCGRAKDVIIMGGRNIYPTDIERIAQTVPGVRAGNAAAVRIDAGERREGFGIIVESKQADQGAERARIESEVRAAVTAQLGVRPTAVQVVPAGTVPKTPSGKIRRTAAAALLH